MFTISGEADYTVAFVPRHQYRNTLLDLRTLIAVLANTHLRFTEDVPVLEAVPHGGVAVGIQHRA